MRKSDVTTESILNLIEEHMLLEDPGSRIDSAMLCSKLADIVDLSKNEVGARAGPMTAVLSDLLSDIDAYATDPDVISQPTQTQYEFSRGVSLPSKQTKKTQRMKAMPRLKTTLWNSSPSQSTSRNTIDNSMPIKRPLAMKATPNPTLRVTQASFANSYDTVASAKYVTKASDTSQFPITRTPQDSDDTKLLPRTYTKQESSLVTAPMVLLSIADITTSDSQDTHDSNNPSHAPPHHGPLDIEQVRQELNAKVETKSHKFWAKFGFPSKVDSLLESYFKNRDMTFVVNGTSMAQHWPNVLFTIETLYLKLDGLDKNSIDLFFTDRKKSSQNKEDLKRSWGRTSLLRSMNEAQPAAPNAYDERVRTNMREVLSPIFQKFMASRRDRRMTLIVLTDGVWEGSNNEDGVAQKITEFYKKWQLKGRVVEDRWFSIQFVSFGNDEAALHRLQVLDGELGLYGIL